MDFRLSDEQEMLRDTLTRYLSTQHPFDPKASGDNARLWQGMADDLGILGASLPQQVGGLGGGPIETMIVMRALGEALGSVPYLETIVVAGGLLRRLSGERPTALLQAMVAGKSQVALAALESGSRQSLDAVTTRARRTNDGWILDGAKSVVIGAPTADHLLVTARADEGGLSLFLVEADAPGLAMQLYRLLDGRQAADVTLNSVSLPTDALVATSEQTPALLEIVRDEALAALCAEASGIMRRMLDDTVAYSKERKQFGQPLAAFQALQHRMVDMYIAVEEAESASYLATLNLSADDDVRTKACAAAKAIVSDAIRFVGQNAVQLHGAMGMTDELAVGHYFKRATVIEHQLGGADHHFRRYAVAMQDAHRGEHGGR